MKINIKSILNHVVSKYTEATSVAEAKIMGMCGSKHTMDEVVDGRISLASSVVKQKNKPMVEAVVEKASTAKQVEGRVCSALPKKKAPAPMGKPITYTQQHDAPTYPVQHDVKPGIPTMVACMAMFVERGKASVPMAQCR
jgi:hypothetical protein